jgi:hypothetical protein
VAAVGIESEDVAPIATGKADTPVPTSAAAVPEFVIIIMTPAFDDNTDGTDLLTLALVGLVTMASITTDVAGTGNVKVEDGADEEEDDGIAVVVRGVVTAAAAAELDDKDEDEEETV